MTVLKAGVVPPMRGDCSSLLLALRGISVLGVNPPVFDFAFFDLWARPFGLLCLLQALRERGNDVSLLDGLHEVPEKDRSFGRSVPQSRIIEKPEPYRGVPRHYRHFGLSEEAFCRRLEEMDRPDLILVTSAMTYWYPGVFWSIERLRFRFPDVPILLGGLYARLCPDHASRSGADFIQTEAFPLTSFQPALDLYERPRFGLALTSLGCPGRCSYCASSLLWPRWGLRSLEAVVTEIRAQLAFPEVHDLAFYDDALLADKERHFYPLCRELRRFPDVAFHAPNGLHVCQIDDRCARMLRDSSFRTLRLSFEGRDVTVAAASRGKVHPGQFERALECLRKVGYEDDDLETYLLVGLPGQSVDDIARSIDYVLSLGAKVRLAEFSPIPGTPLFDESCRLVPALAEEPLLHNNSVYVPFVASDLSAGEMQELKDRARRGSRKAV